MEYSRDGSSNVAPSGRVLLQATAASSGTTMGVVSIDPGSSTVTFSTFMEFVPSTDQDDNSTQVLTQRYKQAIAQALGTGVAPLRSGRDLVGDSSCPALPPMASCARAHVSTPPVPSSPSFAHPHAECGTDSSGEPMPGWDGQRCHGAVWCFASRPSP